ncbi:hypothetical protein SCUP515_02579 [Seiridium cupressi]
MSPFKVIIIGSGLSGSLLANGLAKHNIDYRVYERDEENSERQGYQIRFGENALVGMRACLHRDHLSRVASNFGPNSRVPIIYDKKFSQFLDLNQLPAYSKSAPIDRIVLRDILAKPITQLGRLNYGKKFIDFQIIQEGQSERVQVSFDDGSTDTCDVLVGADGNRSKVKHMIVLPSVTQADFMPIQGITAFLTKCDLPLSLYNKVDQELLTSPIATLQDDKMMYFCAYLPKDYTSMRKTVDSAKFDEESSSCMLSLCWPERFASSFSALSLEQRWDAVREIYRDWSSKHQQVLDLCHGQDMFILNPRVGNEPPRDWRKKVASPDNPAAGNPHVWLMGDAIHPMIPNRGMGGQQAMRDTADALPLILKLSQKASSSEGLRPEDFAAACNEYEDAMIPRAFDWVRKSGNDNWVPLDLSKTLHRLVIRIGSSLIPLARIGYWIISWIVDTKRFEDAPEFAAAIE